MHKSIVKTLLAFSLTTVFFSSTAHATLILEEYDSNTPTPTTIGGYAMTDFLVTNSQLGNGTSTVDSPLGGQLTFTDEGGAVLDLTRGLADLTSWWINGESSDYNIFTTSVHWVTILLPENTRAFSFNVGANMSATGWLKATETIGYGINSQYDFNLDETETPGFGIYASNDSGQCSALTSVTIEPIEWGVGNFSINNDSCSTTVPEPASGFLFGLGIAGLLLYREMTYR